jgi:FAD/FMN-containing dehydrogenase
MGIGLDADLAQHARLVAGGAKVVDDWVHVAPGATTLTPFALTRLTAADKAAGFVRDASGVVRVHPAHEHSPESVAELKDIVTGLPAGRQFTIAGSLHSGGGQALQDGAELIRMHRLDGLRYDPNTHILTAQAGAMWEQAQRYLDTYGQSIAVQQSSNVFNIGGAVATNIHGRDVRFGPLVDTIMGLKLLRPDGTELSVTRGEAGFDDAVRATVGGYGKTGIVTEVQLRTVANEQLERRITTFGPGEIAARMKDMAADEDGRLLQVRVPTAGADRLQSAEAIEYRAVPGEAPSPLKPEKPHPLGDLISRGTFRLAIHSNFGKRLLWGLERHRIGLGPAKASRNSVMAPSVEFLRSNSHRHMQPLQEYFVPPDRIDDFLTGLRGAVDDTGANLLNVTLRWTKAQETDTYMKYAPGDRIAAVLYLDQRPGEVEQARMDEFTRQAAQAALDQGGTFYLPYQDNAFTPAQLDRGYPQRQAFFDAVDAVTQHERLGGAMDSLRPEHDAARIRDINASRALINLPPLPVASATHTAVAADSANHTS